jgi:type I restriction enzyme S subunit
MTVRITRRNKGVSTLPLTVSAQHGLVDQITFFNKTVASADLENYYLLKNGDFAYNKSYSAGYPWGAIKRLDKYPQGVLSSLYICFKELPICDSDYLTHYFETTKWHKEISMVSVEGARNHGLLNVAIPDFFDTLHHLPELAEQERISTFMNLYYRKCDLQRSKIDFLRQQRRAILEDFFARHNRNLVNLTTVCKSKQKGTLYSIAGFGTVLLHNEFLENSTSPTFVADKPNVSKEDILILWDGAQAGKVYTGYEGFLGSTFCAVQTKNNSVSKYVYYMLTFAEKRIQHTWREGSGVPHVAKDFIDHYKIPLPPIHEQLALVKIMECVDKKLLLEQQRLAQLQQFKRGLLQQMFA